MKVLKISRGPRTSFSFIIITALKFLDLEYYGSETVVYIFSAFWNLAFSFVAKSRNSRLRDCFIIFWVAVGKYEATRCILPVQFLFFLKNPITEPHCVSIWMILNDSEFISGVSWHSVNTLIRLQSLIQKMTFSSLKLYSKQVPTV